MKKPCLKEFAEKVSTLMGKGPNLHTKMLKKSLYGRLYLPSLSLSISHWIQANMGKRRPCDPSAMRSIQGSKRLSQKSWKTAKQADRYCRTLNIHLLHLLQIFFLQALKVRSIRRWGPEVNTSSMQRQMLIVHCSKKSLTGFATVLFPKKHSEEVVSQLANYFNSSKDRPLG